MELQEFITGTLIQVCEAVIKANEQIKNQRDFEFVPFSLSPQKGGEFSGISFDIAVTTKSEKRTEGKAIAKIVVVEGGMGSAINSTLENVSRMKFTVSYGSWIATQKTKSDPDKKES